MQQANSKKYKFNPRPWCLPGYLFRIVIYTVFSALSAVSALSRTEASQVPLPCEAQAPKRRVNVPAASKTELQGR